MVVIGFNLSSVPAYSAIVACDAVANQATGYSAQVNILATQQQPTAMLANWDGEKVAEMGGWHLYRTQRYALERNACRPQTLTVQSADTDHQNIIFYPVLKNQRQNRWAVFTGQFLIEASSELTGFAVKNWKLRATQQNNGLDRFRYMLNIEIPKDADLNYDQVIEKLQFHPKIRHFTPVFIEQRYHLR